jgi:hypothetical protein
MVPANSNGASPTPPYSGSYLSSTSCAYGSVTLCGLVSHPVRLQCRFDSVVLLPLTSRNQSGLGSCAFARHYWRNHCCFLLLRVLRCFSSPGSPPSLTTRIIRLHRTGLPHSDTCGSIPISGSPQLFAAYHVLLRL